MSRCGPSLLERIQGLLERTYDIRAPVTDIGRFVIGDHGYRLLYANVRQTNSANTGAGEGARTLVRETENEVRVCIYYPDTLIRCLEVNPPDRGLRDSNVDAFATLVEELDHLLYIAERAREGRPLSLFEMELHANVSKHLVLARFLAGRRLRIGARRKLWLRYHQFDKAAFCDEDPAVRGRYRDAARWAIRFLAAIEALEPRRRIESLRAFHRVGAGAKLELIGRLTAQSG